MKKENIKYCVIIGILCIATIVAIIVGVRSRGQAADGTSSHAVSASGTSSQELVKKTVFETKEKIDTQIIEDGLTEMGFLVTSKYYFTEVTSTSKVTSLWNIDLGFTKANMVISYEGYVPAGVDFTKITVSADDDAQVITVDIPDAELMDAYIDPDSFQKLDESENIFNKFSVSDYNDALKDLESVSLEKAQERGLLSEAQKNAETLIRNFVESLTVDSGYTIEIR